MAEPLPICLIIDDPAPVINPLYYFRLQVSKMERPQQESGERILPVIPLELLEQFAEAAARFGVRGKFSVLPYPAGLGSILDGWPGGDKHELEAWLRIAREQVAPLFDITPEILTHTLTLGLDAKELLPVSEHEWSQQQDEETLAHYIAASLEILRLAGFDATGVTSPCDFGRLVEQAYAGAVLRAQREVCGRVLTWYFLHTDTDPAGKQSHVVFRDDAGGAVVSVVSKYGDFVWESMETQEAGSDYVGYLADRCLTSDGNEGQLAALVAAGVPVVFHTHWQSLYSNGRFTGMRALEVVFGRVATVWEDKVEWLKCSALAERIARG